MKKCVFVNYEIEKLGIKQGINWVKADDVFQDDQIVFYEKNKVGKFGIYDNVKNESNVFYVLLHG